VKRALAAAVLCLPLAGPLRADDTDIFQIAGVEPNVMILFDSSGSMNDEIGGERKIDIAKQVVTDLIQNTTNVRFGVMKFRDHGGQMVAAIGSDTATMITAINAITPQGATPLGDQLYDAGQYFKGSLAGYSSPIGFECQQNYAIVITDGLQNQSNKDIRAEATLRHSEDHAGGLTGPQNVIVHTIGFGIDDDDEEAANDILEEAAENGGGQFFYADDAAQLEAGLEAAIQAISAATYSFAAPLVASTSVTGSTKAFQASFLTDPGRPFWRGYLAAYQRDASGQVPVGADGVPLPSALLWEAGQKLTQATAASRTIFTAIAGVKHSFTTANGAVTSAMLGVASATERTELIDFIRGVDSYDADGDGNTSEQREWKLGDILHSAPVLVSPPPLMSDDPAYQAFRIAQANRPIVLLVGANDGMLHAFRESDGVERWAFIPPDLLGSLKQLAPAFGPHPYFVDSSPVVADVKIGVAYKTIVVFGERRGGRRYHALDITDTTNPAILWSFNDVKSGESWSVPVVGRVRMADGSSRYAVFFGGGYDTANNNASGKALFAVDAATGQKLWEYFKDGSADDRQLVGFSLAGSPTLVDLDADGFVDRVYAGDVGGQLWKFDVSAAATFSGSLIDNWSGKRLFAADPTQPNPPPGGNYDPAQAIYGAPAVAFDADGSLWVYFGTGDLNHPTGSSQNRFYGLRDDTDMSNGGALTAASLVDVTTTDASGGNGWFIRLAANEKVLSGADVFGDAVLFTTFEPEPAASCDSGGGPARLYALQMETGYGALDWSTGELLEASDSSRARSTDVGSGIPSRPLVVATEANGALSTTVVTGTTDEQLDGSTGPSVALKEILYWREVLN